MSLYLDSTTAIDLIRGHAGVREHYARYLRTSGEPYLLSVIVAYELIYGARKSSKPSHVRDTEALLNDGVMVSLEKVDARTAGELRADLETGGVSVALPDLLIAAQALNRGWMVVTSNVRHFGRVPRLEIVDWRVSDQPLTAAEISGRLA